jgi:excinuclease ABC subunit A
MIPKIHRKVKTIQDVGLGLHAGSAKHHAFMGSPTHKIKQGNYLKDRQHFLYLDEPTTGFILKIYVC